MTEAVVHPDGRVLLGGLVFRAALGRGGIRADKAEGDGATPVGVLPLRRVLYRADRLAVPRTVVPREPIAPDDGWCDDPGHPDYNRQVRLPHPARHEELWRRDEVYDIVGVLGWNDAPVQRGRGSAIFLHVARPDLSPTEGCVALALPDLKALLAAELTSLRVLAP
ncbi:L,D-transpeptidase family protein [Limobrevibacterium gyesilva]|uniref:L,D-transpeptidase family protein n=1 Tax=Limobrevibacterium gyesilva TaxID=2991712 RepID=A0AA42CG13_9PROT|nr:L,D-transpeptidase family protein [Limobrevibacterium gyesilva]MCW3473552.1 L,D-transpeptidase family protein [Limobrevibacterium gyesilva]